MHRLPRLNAVFSSDSALFQKNGIKVPRSRTDDKSTIIMQSYTELIETNTVRKFYYEYATPIHRAHCSVWVCSGIIKFFLPVNSSILSSTSFGSKKDRICSTAHYIHHFDVTTYIVASKVSRLINKDWSVLFPMCEYRRNQFFPSRIKKSIYHPGPKNKLFGILPVCLGRTPPAQTGR